MTKLGKIIWFIPAANTDHSSGFPEILREKVPGKIVFIHEEHRWFRVEFQMGDKPGCIGHECFKF